MENSPRNQSQEDKAAAIKAEAFKDDDDDTNEKSEKHAPRHAPGISVERVKASEKAEKPKLSITDRLLESIGAKPEKAGTDTEAKLGKEAPEANQKVNTADKNEQGPKEVSEASLVDDTGKLIDDEVGFDPDSKLPDIQSKRPVAETDEPEHPKDHADPKHQKHHDEPVPDAVLDTADWEEEAGSEAEAPEYASSGEVRPEPHDEHEDFADLPPAPEPEGEEPEVEVGFVEPELMESGLGSEGPPEPPEVEPPAPSGGAGDPPEPPIRTTTHYYSGGGSPPPPPSPWYNAAAADRDRARELADAEYHGRREGTRRGVLTGLLFGWLIGRHGKKKQAREFTKELKSRNKEIDSLKSEQNAAALRLEALKTTQEHMVANIQSKGSKPPVAPANAPQKAREAFTPAPRSEKPPRQVGKRLVQSLVEVRSLGHSKEKARAAEKAAEVLEVAAAKAALTAITRSEHRSSRSEAVDAQKRNPEDQVITKEMYETMQGRRVETSAWHRIEIDEKTGKPVENPEVSYGEEFRHEQAQEIFNDNSVAGSADNSETMRRDNEQGSADTRREKGSTVGSPAAQLGGLAAASFASADRSDETYYSRKSQESGLGAGIPAVSHPDHLKHKNLLRLASEPAVWVVAAIVVIVLFAIGIFR
jgi:hypothetical protein